MSNVGKDIEQKNGVSGIEKRRGHEGALSRTRIEPNCESKSVLGLMPRLERHTSKSQRRIGHLGGKGTIQSFTEDCARELSLTSTVHMHYTLAGISVSLTDFP